MLDCIVSSDTRALGEKQFKSIVGNYQLRIRYWSGRAGLDDVLGKVAQRSKLERPIDLIG